MNSIQGCKQKRLCYIHFGVRNEPGLNKKLDAQIEQFKYAFSVNEIDLSTVNMITSTWSKLAYSFPFMYISKYDYKSVLKYIDSEIIYIRRDKSDRYFVKFLREIKKKNMNSKILIEIPTYPYFKDDFNGIKSLPKLIKEIFAIPHFKNYVDRFVTYSNDKEIFGVPTIKVKNGIYVDQIVPRTPAGSDGKINILAVATFRKHHGYERIIKGLAEYYANRGERNIILRMVGEGEEKQNYETMVNKYDLNKHVVFLGKMLGDELSHQYDIADIALGSFGMYKIDVFNSSVLKIREYLAKGLPIVSGCHEDAFEDEKFNYYLEFPNDDSVIDIKKIIDFYDFIYSKKTYEDRVKITYTIHEYAKRQVNYDVVFKNVIDYLNGVV